MLYSADALHNITRKLDALHHQGDPAYWFVVPCKAQGWTAHFEIARPDSDWLLRIIAALTQSQVGHVEWESTDFTPAEMIARAESKLGLPYDFEGALEAWKNSGHHTEGMEFCSGMFTEIVHPVVPVTMYTNPGTLLAQVTGILDLPMPKLALPPVEITQAEFDWLDALHEERDEQGRRKIAMGTLQEIKEVLSA